MKNPEIKNRLPLVIGDGTRSSQARTDSAFAAAWAFVAFVVVIAVASIAGAQTTVRVVNRTPYPRADIVTVVVPHKQGTRKPGAAMLRAGTRFVQSAPVGAPWPDGTIRFERCRVPVVLKAWEAQEITLRPSTTDETPAAYSLHPRLERYLLGLRVELRIGEDASVPLVLSTDIRKLPDRSGHLVWACRTFHRRGPLWAELTAEVPARLPMIRFWLQWGYSSPGDPRLQYPAEKLELAITGAASRIRFADRKVLSQTPGGVYRLLDADASITIAEGQSQMVAGVMMFGGREELAPPSADPGEALDNTTLEAVAEMDVLSIADWRGSGAYGPFGVVPAAPTWMTDARKDIQVRALAEWPGKPRGMWDDSGHLCTQNPSITGAQQGFGVTRLGFDARAFSPLRFLGVQRSCYQEACRPGGLREDDGTIANDRNRPGVVLNSGFIHYRGKGTFGKDMTLPSRGVENWRGYDREHYMLLALLEYAMLTGDAGATRLVEIETEKWLFSNPMVPKGTTHHLLGVERATGRVAHTGAWMWLLSHRADVAARLRFVVDRCVSEPPIRIRPKRANDDWPYLVHWEAALAAKGLFAVHGALGYEAALQRALSISEALAEAAVRPDATRPWAWWYVSSATSDAHIGDAPSFGTSMWALPAIELGIMHAPDATAAWVARSKEIFSSWIERHGSGWDELQNWRVR